MGEKNRTNGRTQPYLWDDKNTVIAEDSICYQTQDYPTTITNKQPTFYRVETGVSRYPIHRLSNRGLIEIEITERDEQGIINQRWSVSYNSKYGQPGPLAYRLDTLVVQRVIDEAKKPLSRLIRLGSLSDICRMLGMSDSGLSYLYLRRALRQNAHAAIDALISWKDTDKEYQTLEASFTRYSVIFKGDRMPDGNRKADAVYLLLNDLYHDFLQRCVTRPLDYEYCSQLPPGAHRWYELVSYQIYACLRYGLPCAVYKYKDLCHYAPLTIYDDPNQAKKQLYKLHQPHLKSGYLEKVSYKFDSQGELLIQYTPGQRAKAEFRESMRFARNALY